MTDFRALCIELTDCLEKADWPLRYRYVFRQWVDIARAALADEPAVPDGREPASVVSEPTYDDLSELCSQHGLDVDSWPLEKFDALWETARAVLARWGTPNFAETRSLLRDAPQPVPVSERLPGPGDRNTEGKCWWFCTAYPGEWPHWILGNEAFCDPTHWLPAHALPIPQQQETAND